MEDNTTGQNNPKQGKDPIQSNSVSGPQDNNMIMGIISYLGPLSIVSYLMGKDNEFVKFHAKQGIAVFWLEVIVWILGSMMWSLWMLLNIINLATLVLSVIGIMNVVQNKMKELPLIGSFANGLKI